MRSLFPVVALLTSVALLLAGNGLQGVLLPVRARVESFSDFAIGLLATFYFAGFLLGCRFGARTIRAVGHIRAFSGMTALVTAVALVSAFWPVPPLWWALRLCTGYCFAVLFMTIESWLNEAADAESRSFVLTVYMVINLSVICVGQLMLSLNPIDGMGGFALVAILLSLAAVPVALSPTRAPMPITSTRPRIRRLFGVSPAGVGSCLFVGLSTGSFWALAPGFAAQRGFDSGGISLLMSMTVLGGALGQWPLGRLSDFVDRRWVIALGALISAVAAGSLALVEAPDAGIVFACCVVWGASILPIYTLGLAHANDNGQVVDFVEISAGLLLVHAAGSAVSPLCASLLAVWVGDGAVFLWPAVAMSLLAVFVLWRRTQSAAPAPEDQISFVEALQAARTVSPVFDEEIQAELGGEDGGGTSEPDPGAATPPV